MSITPPLQVLVTGSQGRMGRQVIAALEERVDTSVAVTLEQGDSLPNTGAGVDVVIDFTGPAATRAIATWCASHQVPLVTGTTGLSVADEQALDDAARSAPVLHAPNMSVGVNLLCDLVERATVGLGPGVHAEVVEIHHRHKKDAPSGTAMRLGEVIASARGQQLAEVGCFERHGDTGARTEEEIGMQTLRGGDVVGEHTVYFLLDGERIELTHRATDRAIFARGAVRAARWIASQSPGRYTMADVLSG